MATDRQDIDALLIGALYGELDADERARLDAHLASHPQDRSALEGMRSTRAMLRDAELATLLGSAEPAPAISARLLQEAARRAPAKAAGGGLLAFLATMFRPLVASPALSALAAFVLIGGAAGILYSRGSFKDTEPTVGAPRDQVAKNEAGRALAPDPAPASGTAAIDDYRVTLEEQAQRNQEVAPADPSTFTFTGKPAAIADNAIADGSGAAAEGDVAMDKRDSSLGFQNQTREGRAPAKKAPPEVARRGTTASDTATPQRYMAVAPVSKDQPTVLTPEGLSADADRDGIVDERREAERKNDGPGAAAPVPAPPPPEAPRVAQTARDAGSKGGAYNPQAAAALDAWARDQHTRMTRLVQQGKCIDAGAIGAEIARKAPDYYQANVANDRQLRSCRSYVDRARRARSEDVKSKAAAPRAPAPDAQQDLESPAPAH